jgi:spore coat protein U-like protein
MELHHMTRYRAQSFAFRAAFAALAVLGLDCAHAGQATTSFTASAVIAPLCTVSATNLTFGNYTPTSATALTGTSTINVFCTSGTTYTILLNIGSGGGTFATRSMANGTNLMSYNLYTSAAHTTVWGDGTLSTGTVAGAGTGLLTTSPQTVFGNIPISQDLPAGTYQSVITVTVNY